MALPKQPNEHNTSESHWKVIYRIGGVTALIVLIATILDIMLGIILGGDLSTLPISAIDKFNQFQDNWLVGLYNLDALNLITTLLMIPTYFALCTVHRRANIGFALLATLIYFVGATVFITNNVALPMLELSSKYAIATSEAQKTLLAAAGEALIARGAHGSFGAFPGFLLLSLGSTAMSFVMLKGKIFSKSTAYVGIIGSALMLVYTILVTFVPTIKNVAVMIAAPGGLLVLAWMVMYTIKLFRLSSNRT